MEEVFSLQSDVKDSSLEEVVVAVNLMVDVVVVGVIVGQCKG